MFTVVTWKPKRWHVKSAVRSLPQIFPLKATIEVVKQKIELQLSQHFGYVKQEFAQLQTRFNELWHLL